MGRKSNKSDNLDSTLLVSRQDAVCIGLVIPGTVSMHQRVMTQHHPYEQGGATMYGLFPDDRTRVAQSNSQRVTIWKNVCLLFWTGGANRFEGGECTEVLMGGVKIVCVVCIN
jgi:hypothetical protein